MHSLAKKRGTKKVKDKPGLYISTGTDSTNGGRWIWHASYKKPANNYRDAIVYLVPQGVDTAFIKGSVAEFIRVIESLWHDADGLKKGAKNLLDLPEEYAGVIQNEKQKQWDKEKKNPPKVDDENPTTWPPERYTNAETRAEAIAFIYALKNIGPVKGLFDRFARNLSDADRKDVYTFFDAFISDVETRVNGRINGRKKAKAKGGAK
jgi:hypothetical protein